MLSNALTIAKVNGFLWTKLRNDWDWTMQATAVTVDRVDNSCREACAEGYLQIAKVRSASDFGFPGEQARPAR
ncbi:hypothetical protein MESS2_650055 [Mesorhizobium metallidurans STM 2683]|uniref:Uncharacterized protein n=1 Tax=Mesorhizobium metallidurans STM 2683 TaxID=1297569 RepID=M5EV20_9HYPH|nr:hypothetical protein MESS2_650055 [Mesorhizobium metallidurans STM 2683]